MAAEAQFLPATDWPRRRVLRLVAGLGAGAVFGRALVHAAEGRVQVTDAMIHDAEWVSGVALDDEKRRLMLDGINEMLGEFAAAREVALDNGIAPALWFRAQPETVAGATPAGAPVQALDAAAAPRPGDESDLAFAGVAALSSLVRRREVSAEELARLALDRLTRLGPVLECVITLTADLALDQARLADRELAAGRWKGPLHGIPWGAKDLLAVPGYPTTWGAAPYREQVLDDRATVAARLDRRGAVLAAKLSLGALAWGETWFGGRTRNPWNTAQGSSGSSAGPAAATAAGLLPFAIGSETWGSIVSPCTRCGVTGLRPTFGRVSRHGAMALSWSMDKLGPIARSAEDCALVFAAIHGADGLDPTALDRPYGWPLGRDVRTLRVGYLAELFDEDRAEGVDDADERRRAVEWQALDRQALDVLRGLGLKLEPVGLPSGYPVSALSFILTAEAATAFDELTRSGRDAELVRQVEQAWPNVFRQGQLIPAVEYLRANRIRSLVMRETAAALDPFDVVVTPSFGGDVLLRTNLTGHPCVVVPDGFRADGTPVSLSFLGRPFGETGPLAVAHAFQQATDHHLRRPPVGGAAQGS